MITMERIPGMSLTEQPLLRLGALAVEKSEARSWVQAYLNGAPGQYGFPSYDGYRTNDDPHRLCDGDLLAPVLLNVRMKIHTFADLKACGNQLTEALEAIPTAVDLARADEESIASVGRAFSILSSNPRPRGVQGTTLSKILHRKRPAIVPLYDRAIGYVYRDAPGAPIERDRKRSWPQFITQLARAMREDLNRSLGTWDEFAALAPEGDPPVSRLRALDIVAWHLGERSRGVVKSVR